MRKKAVVVFYILFGCYTTHTKTTAEPLEFDQSDNPYTLTIRSAMLPPNQNKKKIKMMQSAIQMSNGLAPKLLLIRALYANNDLQKIVTMLENIKGLKTFLLKDPQSGMVAVKTYIKLKKNKEAMRLLVKLNEQHPTDQETAFLLAQLYEGTQQLENCLKVINTYLNKSVKKASNIAFLIIKSRVHLKLNNQQAALASITEALAMQPRFDMGWLIFAQLHEKKGELERAIKGYSNYLDLIATKQKNPMSQILFKAIEQKLLRMILAITTEKYSGDSQQKKCQDHLNKLFLEKKYKGALKALDNLMSKHSCNEEKRLLKIQFLGATKQYKQAIKLVKTWILENPNNSLWFEALHLLYFAGVDASQIIATLHEIEKKVPNNLFVSLYLADLLTRTANTTSAIVYHNKALTRTNDPQLKTSILFQLGMLYYETKQFTLMKTALEHGHSLGLEYAPLLNLLAYYYTTQENNFTKAQELMTTVLSRVPNNPHFIDTQALIFYKQKNYVQALTLLENIVQQEPDDTTIIKHLAKTYKQLGKTEQGVACMQRVATLTYDDQKKTKYLQIAQEWTTKNHEQKKDHMLCRR